MIANSLFHFTEEIGTLKLILESSGLKPSYNIERVDDFAKDIKFMGIPMVCFCDIPLKFIDQYGRYGKYGIGFTKKWGIDNNIRPIQYRLSNSSSSNPMRELNSTLNRMQLQITEQMPVIQKLIKKNISVSIPELLLDNLHFNMEVAIARYHELSYLTKPYKEGKHINYLDREWRLIPDHSRHLPSNNNYKKTKKKMNEENAAYLSLYDFKIDDIEHVIIKDRDEVDMIIDIVKGLKINKNDKFKLMQKVTDIERINTDN